MQGPTIAQVPFDCPHCGRGYHVDIDLQKLARLNRVAVCGACGNRFSVNIRFRQTAGDDSATEAERPFDRERSERPTPVPARSRTPPPPATPVPDSGSLRRPAPKSGPRVGASRMNTKPEGLSIPQDFRDRFARPTKPRLGEVKTDPSPAFVDARESASRPHPYDAADTAATDPQMTIPEEVQRHMRQARTEPELTGPTSSVPPFDERRPRVGPTSNPPPSERRRTLDGVPSSPPPPKKRVKTEIIVEVGDASKKADASKSKKAVYAPHHLVTKPGIGVPNHLLKKRKNE